MFFIVLLYSTIPKNVPFEPRLVVWSGHLFTLSSHFLISRNGNLFGCYIGVSGCCQLCCPVITLVLHPDSPKDNFNYLSFFITAFRAIYIDTDSVAPTPFKKWGVVLLVMLFPTLDRLLFTFIYFWVLQVLQRSRRLAQARMRHYSASSLNITEQSRWCVLWSVC